MRKAAFAFAAFGLSAIMLNQAKANEISDQKIMNTEIDHEVLARIRGASEIVAMLEENEEEISDERPVELFFYGDRQNLESLAKTEALSDYTLKWLDDPTGLTASKVVVVDEEWVVRTAHDMVMAARENNVEYDGWEAAFIRQGKR